MKGTHQGGVTGVHVTLGSLLNDIQIMRQLRKLSQVSRENRCYIYLYSRARKRSGTTIFCKPVRPFLGARIYSCCLNSTIHFCMCCCTIRVPKSVKVASYSFTIAHALATKVQAICARLKGNVSVFLYFITST